MLGVMMVVKPLSCLAAVTVVDGVERGPIGPTARPSRSEVVPQGTKSRLSRGGRRPGAGADADRAALQSAVVAEMVSAAAAGNAIALAWLRVCVPDLVP